MLVTSVANIILFGGKSMKLVELNAHNLNNEFIARLDRDYREMSESMGTPINEQNNALIFVRLDELKDFGNGELSSLVRGLAEYSQKYSQKDSIKSTDKLIVSTLRNSLMGVVSVVSEKTDGMPISEDDYSQYYNSEFLSEFEDYVFYPNQLQEVLTELGIDVTITIEQAEPLTKEEKNADFLSALEHIRKYLEPSEETKERFAIFEELVEEIKQSWREYGKPVVEQLPEEPKGLDFDDSLESKQQLIYEDYKEGVPAKTLATIYSVSVGYVYTVINRHKSPDAPRKGVALKVAHILDDTTKVNQVIADYTSGKSTEELYEEYDLHKNGLYYILDLYDVPRRGHAKRKDV